ncbi:MAG: virulence RhuM family protein [Candidatus Saganbacteria bacterium]|nr:virulence RhuM family protein [Candidatus Saganbacteria bacterium]
MNKNNGIIIYTSEDGQTRLDVRMDHDTVWLSQKHMAELFQCSTDNIGLHLKNIFKEGELSEESVAEEYSVTATDGKKYKVKHYNLDAIISVGYRVSSHIGTRFRIWATQKLREYIVKGFVMDDNRLANGGVKKSYFDELVERVRKIRTSERNFYLKVTDIFATSVDYESKADYAQQFFAVVQNKFHYAITGFTAAELISSRIDANKQNMGLTNWEGKIITRQQAQIAKNYLEELELRRLMLLVEQFLSFAELQAVEKRVMYMKDWIIKLDQFLHLNEKKILIDAGKISHSAMEAKVRAEPEKFNQKKLPQHKANKRNK